MSEGRCRFACSTHRIRVSFLFSIWVLRLNLHEGSKLFELEIMLRLPSFQLVRYLALRWNVGVQVKQVGGIVLSF